MSKSGWPISRRISLRFCTAHRGNALRRRYLDQRCRKIRYPHGSLPGKYRLSRYVPTSVITIPNSAKALPNPCNVDTTCTQQNEKPRSFGVPRRKTSSYVRRGFGSISSQAVAIIRAPSAIYFVDEARGNEGCRQELPGKHAASDRTIVYRLLNSGRSSWRYHPVRQRCRTRSSDQFRGAVTAPTVGSLGSSAIGHGAQGNVAGRRQNMFGWRAA
jgi:hypothetical protein